MLLTLHKHNLLSKLKRKILSVSLLAHRFLVDRERINNLSDFYTKTYTEFQTSRPKSLIIMDTFSIPEWVISAGQFANILGKDKNSEIKLFSKKRNINFYYKKLYAALNINSCIQTKLKSKNLKQEKIKIFAKAKVDLKSKQLVFDYQIYGIWIGIDIYETYLRRQNPTIDFSDSIFWKTVDESIELLIFWRDFFSKNNVSAVIVSHDCYNTMNILAKVAYSKNIPVYAPNARGISLLTKPFSIYANLFYNYKNIFNSLTSKEKENAIKLSKHQLNSRLSGQVGVDMSYSTKSAFLDHAGSPPVLKRSNRKKVVILVHDFYDNPHGYGGMLFIDFYEWLRFLVNISKKTKYDWYIKTHPDYSPGTLEILSKIVLKDSRINLLPPETSFHQLSREGLDFALTCYGSCGHELPLLGIQVINCAYNPHIAFNFNWHAKSISEYEYLIMNIPTLSLEFSVESIYEFYYVHYFYTYVDDLIYKSHRGMEKSLTTEEQLSLKSYEYYKENFDSEFFQISVTKIRNFIQSKKSHLFIKGPQSFE